MGDSVKKSHTEDKEDRKRVPVDFEPKIPEPKEPEAPGG